MKKTESIPDPTMGTIVPITTLEPIGSITRIVKPLDYNHELLIDSDPVEVARLRLDAKDHTTGQMALVHIGTSACCRRENVWATLGRLIPKSVKP
jgi:hypothetical protein